MFFLKEHIEISSLCVCVLCLRFSVFCEKMRTKRIVYGCLWFYFEGSCANLFNLRAN